MRSVRKEGSRRINAVCCANIPVVGKRERNKLMAGQLKPTVGSTDHVQGERDAPVTLVEYGDYQCPYCGQAYPIVKRLQKRLGSQLRFVFRNFPLAEAHPFAMAAAEMAEAAALQGKFWQMHDSLYEHQDALEPERL